MNFSIRCSREPTRSENGSKNITLLENIVANATYTHKGGARLPPDRGIPGLIRLSLFAGILARFVLSFPEREYRTMDRSNESYRNRLLQLLHPADFDRLRPHLKPVALEYRQSLYEANQNINFVYFPIEGVASLVNTMANGSATEVGTIGNEGIVGLPVIFGNHRAQTSAYVQVPGTGLQLRADVLRNELELNSRTRAIMLHYAHAFFNQVAQSAACAHFHSVEQRCCRWLLMTHDRVNSDQFLLTQEFLGMMLGVRRTSVTDVAHELKHRKLIEYSRGRVTILDRSGLEKHACECYLVTKKEFDRLLGLPLGLRSDLSGKVEA